LIFSAPPENWQVREWRDDLWRQTFAGRSIRRFLQADRKDRRAFAVYLLLDLRKD